MTFKTTKLRDAISFALAVSAASSGTAFAQDTQQKEATTLGRVEVTGSRIRQVDKETTSPVLTLDRHALEATGLTSVGDVLFNITASDGGALRNITTGTNGSDGTQNISLRGLGAGRTLVLVNGRRWLTQGDGTTDLNTIPISVVERIEVLKDGASAIYGSDAIAGVINVITRTNYEGGEARAYIGQYTKGDGFQQAYDFTLGANTDRINTVFSVSYTEQDPVFAGDRERANMPIFGGGDLASGGPFGSGTTDRGNFTRCAGAITATPAGFTTCTRVSNGPGTGVGTGISQFGNTLIEGRTGTSATDYRPFVNYTFDGSGHSDRYNYSPVNYILQPIERFNAYGQGTVRLTDSINANVMTTYVKRTSNQQLAQVPATMDITGANGPQWAFAPTAGNVFNPFGQNMRSFAFRNVAVGPRNPHYQNDNIAFTGWFDGAFELGGRNMYWDAGYSYLDSQFSTRAYNYINLFNLKRAVGNSRRNPTTGALECLDAAGAVIAGCVPYNVFGGPDLGLAAGTISQAEYDAMIKYVSYTQSSTFGNTTKDYFANLSGEIVDLPAGPLGFAIGAEKRTNDFFNEPDALVAGGGSSDNFTEPTSGKVSSMEEYAELQVPILADVAFAKALDLNVAARHVSYDSKGFFGGQTVEPDIGSDTSTKVGLKWQVFDDLMLRGTWSEAFRAPSVTDLFSGGAENFPRTADPCNTTNFGNSTTIQSKCTADNVPVGGVAQPNQQIRSLVGGNPDLTPEKAKTKTFGVVYSPGWLEGLDLTLDWYKITMTDVIASRSAQAILNACYTTLPSGNLTQAQACGFIQRDPTGQIFSLRQTSFNISEGEVEGYDLGVGYKLPETAWGKFSFQWDSTYQSKNDLFGSGVGVYDGSPNFRLRSNLTTSWQMGDWDATWTMRYYSGMDEDCSGINNYFEYGMSPSELCNHDIFDSNGNFLRAENRIPSATFHDVQVGWKTPWNGKVAVGARNVFGKDPPVVRNSFAHSFDGAYDLPGGGFYYLQYTQKF